MGAGMTDTITPAQYKALQAARPTKYKNRFVYECQGCQNTSEWRMEGGFRVCVRCGCAMVRRFDSQAEYARWLVLREAERAGDISDLRRQTIWRLMVNGVLVATYRDDFSYLPRGERVRTVEDVKGFRTPMYQMKAKLMKALHGIVISEVQ